MNYCPQCANPLAETLVDMEVRKACPDQACGFVFFDLLSFAGLSWCLLHLF